MNECLLSLLVFLARVYASLSLSLHLSVSLSVSLVVSLSVCFMCCCHSIAISIKAAAAALATAAAAAVVVAFDVRHMGSCDPTYGLVWVCLCIHSRWEKTGLLSPLMGARR